MARNEVVEKVYEAGLMTQDIYCNSKAIYK